MKITALSNVKIPPFPLPIYASVKIADAVSGEGEKFSVLVGLDEDMVSQLKKYSLDESDIELQKNTGDRPRFGEGSYEEWYQKSRTPFALVHTDTGKLAALVWFGPKPIGQKSVKFGKEKRYETQNKWCAVAYRSYIPFRGKGVMKDFSKYVMEIYEKKFPGMRLWTGSDTENKGFFRFISTLGFEVDKKNSDINNNWLVMVK
jgi:hypothetical protein